MRAGFITTAYRNGGSWATQGIGTLTTLRSYVRRAKLGTASSSGKLDL